MRSFFFRNDGIVLDRSVRSREKTIVPQIPSPSWELMLDMQLSPVNRRINSTNFKDVLIPPMTTTYAF